MYKGILLENAIPYSI